MTDKKGLALSVLAIGSLPCTDVDKAMNLIKENFSEIPFWAQLSKFNNNENMTVQFLENLAGCRVNDNGESFLDSESDEFYSELEQLYLDFEEVISNKNLKVLDKYAISVEYSSTFYRFLELVKTLKPKYAKGQIIGPFTLATTLTDKTRKCAYYDPTLREVIEKHLTLKALWQIYKIKEVSPDTVPIIFMDEPSLSQLRTSAYITINPAEPVQQIKNISDIIKKHGVISAVHCCGRCDWENLIKSDCDIINFDAYSHFEHFVLFLDSIKSYVENGGRIAWGLVPTLNKSALEVETVTSLKNKFENIIKTLVDNNFSKDLLLKNSLISPSCGCASLTEDLAEKAMRLTKELSLRIKEG